MQRVVDPLLPAFWGPAPVLDLDDTGAAHEVARCRARRDPGGAVPLSFFSNIFITPATLPGWLRAFVGVNPVTHLVTATRELMSGTTPGRQIGWVLIACAILTAVFAPLSVRLLRNR